MGRRFLDFDKICYLARLPAIKTVYTRLTSDLYSCGCPGAGRTRAISRIRTYAFISYMLHADLEQNVKLAVAGNQHHAKNFTL